MDRAVVYVTPDMELHLVSLLSISPDLLITVRHTPAPSSSCFALLTRCVEHRLRHFPVYKVPPLLRQIYRVVWLQLSRHVYLQLVFANSYGSTVWIPSSGLVLKNDEHDHLNDCRGSLALFSLEPWRCHMTSSRVQGT